MYLTLKILAMVMWITLFTKYLSMLLIIYQWCTCSSIRVWHAMCWKFWYFNCLWHSFPIFFIYELAAAGRKRATVARPRACTLCRECIREDGWEKYVALRRVKEHFICKYVIQISYLVQSFLLTMYSMRLFTWKHIIGLWFASFFACILLSFKWMYWDDEITIIGLIQVHLLDAIKRDPKDNRIG